MFYRLLRFPSYNEPPGALPKQLTCKVVPDILDWVTMEALGLSVGALDPEVNFGS